VSQPTKADFSKLGEIVQGLQVASAEDRKDIEHLRLAVAQFRDDLLRERELVADLRIENGIQKASFEEYKKRWDESDRRRWTVYGVMLAAALTFVANLVLLFLKR